MDFSIKSGDLANRKTPCLILGTFGDQQLTAPARLADTASGGYLRRMLDRGDLESEVGRTLLLHEVPGLQAERVMLVCLGPKEKYDRKAFIKAMAALVSRLGETRIRDALCTLPASPPGTPNGLPSGAPASPASTFASVPGAPSTSAVASPATRSAGLSTSPSSLSSHANPDSSSSAGPTSIPSDQAIPLALRDAVTTVLDKTYRYESTKSAKKPPLALQGLQFWPPDDTHKAQARQALRQGEAIAHGVSLAKELGNLPGNLCTPSYLASQAQALAKAFPALQVEILEEEAMAKLGMGALLSVSSGSRQPAKLIILTYRGGQKGAKPLILVGKGLTFDAGGISLKPGPDMDQMKFDMCGAASVLGALRAALEIKLPLNLIGVIPAAENLPDGAANKPGDVVTSLSGQTIEILNTDAEGRLILCDALSYCERFNPVAVVDIATLTGACAIALGKVASGLFSADEGLAAELLAAGERANDRAWRLPLWDDYQSLLDCNFADMANVGPREGGAITGACFLSRFTKGYPWAHLDIAGTAWLTGKEKGATGRPVPLLVEFLLQRGGVAI